MHPQFQTCKLEFYREAYNRQLERREHALERLSQLITIYTLVGGIIAFYCSKTLEVSTSYCFWLLVSPAIVGGLAFLYGLCLLAYTLHIGTTFKVLPPPSCYDKKLNEAQNALQASPEADEALHLAFGMMLSAQYGELATFNQAAGNIRDVRYSKIGRLGVWSLLFLIIAAPAFITFQTSEVKPPSEIIITKPIQIMSAPDSPPKQAKPVDPPTPPKGASQAPAHISPIIVTLVAPPPELLNESFSADEEDMEKLNYRGRRK